VGLWARGLWGRASSGTEGTDDGFICVKATEHGVANPKSDTAKVANVRISKLQYRTASDGEWTDAPAAPAEIEVAVDSFLQVQATPSPEATWPKDKPAWTAAGVALVAPVKTNPALRTVTISAAGSHSVTATCGNGATLNIKAFGVEVNSVDALFAPSVEDLDIHYTITPAGHEAPYAKIEIFQAGDDKIPIYVVTSTEDTSIPRSGSNQLYQWDGMANQGSLAGQYVGPQYSPYTVRVSIGINGSALATDEGETKAKVEVESISFLDFAADSKLYMNDPETRQACRVAVKLKKKDGTGTVTAVPMNVWFSFTPGADNTQKEDSYNYDTEADKWLGKAGDDAAVYWGGAQGCEAGSTDDYKLVCYSGTITNTEPEYAAYLGKTAVNFLPSGVGGDNYTIHAAIKHTDGSILATKDSGKLTVWRQVKLEKILEMGDNTHVSTNATEAKIQPYFDDAFVEYKITATRQEIPSVKYIGLWKNDGDHQQDWGEIHAYHSNVNCSVLFGWWGQATVTDENLTQAEKNAVEEREEKEDNVMNPGTNVSEILKLVGNKAQAWTERIDGECTDAYNEWLGHGATDGGAIPERCIVGINYFHPKYNETTESLTDEEFGYACLRVNADHGSVEARPWKYWDLVEGREDGEHDVILIPACVDKPVKTIAHEMGHFTIQFFRRQEFGTDDHSSSGLMHPKAEGDEFSPDELKILRGIALQP
jgi:hypothetical protein